MLTRNLPLLQVDTAYLATDLVRFEYSHRSLIHESEQKSILRVHLKNGATLDLPATDDQMKDLATMLAEAFGPTVIEHLRAKHWI